jgi:hypothetical protein
MQWEAEPQTLDDALAWHEAIVESVLSHRASTLASFHAGMSAAGSRFFAMSYDEIDAFFVKEREEVDGRSAITIVAAAEAAIRADYRQRVQRNLKDPLSRTYSAFHRALSAPAKVRPPFNESGIIDQIKTSGVVAGHVVAEFRRVLRMRHWFAHGRYWTLKLSGSGPAPSDVHAAAWALISALPL